VERLKRELQDAGFDLETIVAMVSAVEDVLNTLQVQDRSGPLAELVALKVMSLARQGERAAARLHDLTVAFFESEGGAARCLQRGLMKTASRVPVSAKTQRVSGRLSALQILVNDSETRQVHRNAGRTASSLINQ
jgi:hypothetical protein